MTRRCHSENRGHPQMRFGFIYPYNARGDRSAKGIAAITHRNPDLLTSACSLLTALGPRVDVEAEVEVGFRQGHVQGVDLITQRHHGLRVPRGAELIQMDVQLPGG